MRALHLLVRTRSRVGYEEVATPSPIYCVRRVGQEAVATPGLVYSVRRVGYAVGLGIRVFNCTQSVLVFLFQTRTTRVADVVCVNNVT